MLFCFCFISSSWAQVVQYFGLQIQNQFFFFFQNSFQQNLLPCWVFLYGKDTGGVLRRPAGTQWRPNKMRWSKSRINFVSGVHYKKKKKNVNKKMKRKRKRNCNHHFNNKTTQESISTFRSPPTKRLFFSFREHPNFSFSSHLSGPLTVPQIYLSLPENKKIIPFIFPKMMAHGPTLADKINGFCQEERRLGE